MECIAHALQVNNREFIQVYISGPPYKLLTVTPFSQASSTRDKAQSTYSQYRHNC